MSSEVNWIWRTISITSISTLSNMGIYQTLVNGDAAVSMNGKNAEHIRIKESGWNPRVAVGENDLILSRALRGT